MTGMSKAALCATRGRPANRRSTSGQSSRKVGLSATSGGRIPWIATQSGSKRLNSRGGRMSDPHVSVTCPSRTTARPTWIGEDR